MFLTTVVGPTGSGKSTLALCLAQQFGGEIVNCDSLQLYRGFDIGTAKTAPCDRRGIPHHLFDVLAPEQSYSAGEYAREARNVIAEIAGRGRVPIVVGGTGFYLRALLEGLPVLPGRDERLRERLMKRERLRPGSLHRLLKRLEPGAAARIHSNDVQKTMRALEVRLLTQHALPPPAEAHALEGYAAIKLGLDPDRALLQQRLEDRTRAMFAHGLLEEVRGLLAGGATGSEKPFEALGYKQVLLYLRGAATLEQAVESTIVETRQYAKRQRTWFRRDPDIRWLQGFGDDAKIVANALFHLEEWDRPKTRLQHIPNWPKSGSGP